MPIGNNIGGGSSGGGGGGTGSVALPNYVRVTPTGGFSDKDPYNTIDNALTAISSGTIALSGENHTFPTKSLNNIVLSGLDEGTIVTTNNLLINNGDTIVFENLKINGSSTIVTPILINNKSNINLLFSNCVIDGFGLDDASININAINGSSIVFNNCIIASKVAFVGNSTTQSVIIFDNCKNEDYQYIDIDINLTSNSNTRIVCENSNVNIIKKTGGELELINCVFAIDTGLGDTSDNQPYNRLTINNGTTYNPISKQYRKIFHAGNCQGIISNCDTNHNENGYGTNIFICGFNNKTKSTNINNNLSYQQNYINVDATNGNKTQTLPVGGQLYNNYIIRIKKIDTTTNKIIVTTSGGQKMINADNGSTTTFTITQQHQYVAFKYNYDLTIPANNYWERMI
jgi:hypothetical protein